MDTSLLQLFTPEEILDRLGRKKCTGCFHLYTTKESANLFLKDGAVVAMSNGSTEGLDVLKQIMNWKEVRYAWMPEVTATGTAFKPVSVPIQDILAQLRTNAEPVRKARSQISGSGTLPTPAATSSPPVYLSIGAKARTTGPLEPAGVTAPKAPSPVAEPISPVQLTATKSFNSTVQDRQAEEESLLKKHRLVLVSVDNPEMRLKITRVSGLLGRNPACEIPIQHPSISRQHCMLQISDRGLAVKDLGTTNGTKVNGITLTEGLVNLGDKLCFGHLTFILERDAD